MENDFIINDDKLTELIKEVMNEITASDIIILRNILEKHNITDYEDETDYFIEADALDLDNEILSYNIIKIFKKHGIEFIRKVGFIIDNDLIDDITINQISHIANAIDQLSSIDINSAIFISAILEEDVEHIVDLYYIILIYFDPTIEKASYYDLIKDINPSLIKYLKATIDNVYKTESIECDTDIDMSIGDISIKLIDIINEYGYNNLPTLIKTLLLDNAYRYAIETHASDIKHTIFKEIVFMYDELKDEINIVNFFTYYSIDLLIIEHVIHPTDDTISIIMESIEKYISNIDDRIKIKDNIKNIQSKLIEIGLFSYIDNIDKGE